MVETSSVACDVVGRLEKKHTVYFWTSLAFMSRIVFSYWRKNVDSFLLKRNRYNAFKKLTLLIVQRTCF